MEGRMKSENFGSFELLQRIQGILPRERVLQRESWKIRRQTDRHKEWLRETEAEITTLGF